MKRALPVIVVLLMLSCILPVLGKTIVLRNGQAVSPEYTYDGCEDTTIDDVFPEGNAGGSPVLKAGDTRKTLVRFGGLKRALGPNKRIRKAVLILTIRDAASTEGALPVRRMLVDWGEGTGATGREPSPWGANWYFRHSPAVSEGEGRPWAREGAEGLKKDVSDKVSAAAQYKPRFGIRREDDPALRIELPAEEVQDMYDRWYANNGWMVMFFGLGGFTFASSEAAVADRPALEVSYDLVRPDPTLSDYAVTCIERKPEIERPSWDAKRPWPKDGDHVTFTAHVKNTGANAKQGFTYEWRLNDVVVRKGTYKKLFKEGEEAAFQLPWKWKGRYSDNYDQTISFTVEPIGKAGELTMSNNCVCDYVQALTAAIYVERSFYDQFGQSQNGIGSRSFEDWVQWQMRLWNEESAKKNHTVGPFRVEKIAVVPDGTLKGPNHTPDGKSDPRFDAEWGFPKDSADSIESIPMMIDKELRSGLLSQIAGGEPKNSTAD